MEEEKDNRFDLTRLRLSQNFESIIGVKKALLTVPVRKPNRQEFVRVHPDESMHFPTAVLEVKEDREIYLVDKPLWSELPGEIIPVVLFTAINRQGVVFLWLARLPKSDGRHEEWSRSALEAAQMAKSNWVRVAANMSLGAYEVVQASGDLSEPEWPDVQMEKLLEVAFKDHYISDFSHPIIRRLRGEI